MKQIKAILCKKSNTKTTWEEIHKIPEGSNPKEYIENIITSFNKERGYDYMLVRLKRTRKGTLRVVHNWQKVSLVTEKGGYDKYKCSLCGATGRRYGVSNFIRPDKKFDATYCKK